MDDFVITIGILFAIALAIEFWPLTLLVVIFYLVRKSVKKQEHKDREARISSLQNDISKTNENINEAKSRKVEIRKTVTNTQSELSQLKGRFCDIKRLQQFFMAFSDDDCEYVLPETTETLISQITAKERLIAKLESEDEFNDTLISRFQSSLESKTQEIHSLQALQSQERKS